MAIVYCPACGNEMEVDVYLTAAQPDVGIMRPQIDYVEWPDECGGCGLALSEVTKDRIELRMADHWLEEIHDRLYGW